MNPWKAAGPVIAVLATVAGCVPDVAAAAPAFSNPLEQVGQRVRVPAGRYVSAIRVRETTRLAGEAPETKWYAAGVGVLRGRTKGERFALIASTLRQP